MKHAPAGLALLALACAPEAPAPPGFELRPVVQPALAALEERLRESDREALPGPELVERIEGVLGALRSGERGLRELAAEDVRALPPAGIEALARVLRDPAESDDCRAGLAEALGASGSARALAALGTALESAPEPWLRAQCAYQLGRTGRDEVIPLLVLRLKYERDYDTAYWMADALGRFRHLAGLDGLFVLWSSAQSAELRERAAGRLNELAREHGAASAQELRERWLAGTLPARMPPFEPSERLVLEAWRRIARLGEWDLRAVDDARFVLSRLEDWVVPLLCEALHESEVHVRIHAAQCLERMGPRARGAAGTLLEALREPRTAPAAAAALGAIGHGPAAPLLEELLDRSGDPEQRVAAASALGALLRTSSLPALRRAFTAGQPLDLRQAAAQALLAIEGAPDALAFLRACLADPLADEGAAELALERFLERRAPADARLEDLRSRWQALGPAPGSLPSEAETRERRRARAALLEELVGPE